MVVDTSHPSVAKRLGRERQNGGRALGKEPSSQVSSGRELWHQRSRGGGPEQEQNIYLREQTDSNSQAIYSGEPTAAMGLVGGTWGKEFQYGKCQGL